MERIVLGGGCFWCLEAVFQRVPGVQKVIPGYAGGTTKNPTYERICAGTADHAEVVAVTFDNEQISLLDILAVFFAVHDPTTKDRQGADIGPQYRSIVLFETPRQKETIDAVISTLGAKRVFPRRIVTEVHPLNDFYPAEEYHHNYFSENRRQPYCQMVIEPKLAELDKILKKTKEES